MMTMEEIYRRIQSGQLVPRRETLLAWSLAFAKKHGRLPTWADVKTRFQR